ncbi:hypothetical protein OIV83_003274 [Microbotryomycetes sp. JL201]|nr:hypothetical protein OIV83_003274 [Microbotryomycetes sp. JL201]
MATDADRSGDVSMNNANLDSDGPVTPRTATETSINPAAPTTTSLGPPPTAPAQPATTSSLANNSVMASSAAVTDADTKSSIHKSNDTTPVLASPSDTAQRPSSTQHGQAASGRQNASTSARQPPSKPKKRGLLGSLFGCCVSSSAFDDEHDRKKPVRPATTSQAQEPAVNEKAAVIAAPTTAPNPLTEKTNLDDATQSEKGRDAGIAPMDANTAKNDAPVASGPSPEGTPLPIEETGGVTAGAVMAPGKEASSPSTPAKTKRRRSGKAPESIITQVPEPGMAIVETDDETDESEDEDEEDEEQSLIARGGVGIPIGEDGLPHPLLEDISDDMKGRKCLVLDLDETLVHSSFKMVHQADYVVPVEIENQYHNVYVIKRPGVDAFLKAMGEIYEIVVFTASLSKYADPVLDQLDVHQVVKHRLFRESCYNNKGNYVKDLSQLGRQMADCIIIDNSPASYVFHVNNAVPISSWFNDPHDTELTDLVPFLTDLEQVPDVRSVLDAGLYQHLPIVV